MSDLVVAHTFEDGAQVRGTERGDGAGELLKPLGWRWGWNLRSWYLPSSRGRAPDRGRLTQTADQLRRGGHSVEMSVVVAPADGYAAAEDRYIKDLQESREALIASVARHESAADKESRAAAAEARRRVDRISEQLDSRRSPGAIRGRIAALERAVATGLQSLSALERAAGEGTTEWCHARDQLELDRGRLAYWQSVTPAEKPGPSQVMPGDQVRIRGHWRTVIRVNAKSVSVQISGWGTGRSPWAEVQEHRAAPGIQRPPARVSGRGVGRRRSYPQGGQL